MIAKQAGAKTEAGAGAIISARADGDAEPAGGAHARRGFGGADVIIALVIATAVFVGLPARYAVVDVPAAVLAALMLGSGIGLLTGQPWSLKLARVAAVVTLIVGLVLLAALCMTASYLRGLYGPVGRGGAIIFWLSAALGFPYLVLAPVAQLYWLAPSSPRTSEST